MNNTIANTAIQLFENNNFGSIRTVLIDGEPWFVGKDVAAALGYKDTVNALKAHVKDKNKRAWRITTPGGTQTVVVINEAGVYRLTLRSKLPSAEKFTDWITDDVIPTLRTTGVYYMQAPKTYPEALRALAAAEEEKAQLKEEKLALEAKIESDKDKVEWAETCELSDDVVSFGDYAKILHKRDGIQIGRNRLFKLARDEKILDERNMPYQAYLDRGWFEVVQYPVYIDGEVVLKFTPYITPQGQKGLAKIVKRYYTAA